MSRMTIGTTGDLLRIAKPIVFTVIAVHIGASCHIEHVVALHHLLIAMTFQADLRMEDPVCMEFWVIHGLDVMEIMAIVTGGRILIAGRHGYPMDRLPVNRFLVMALNTLGNNNTLVIIPVPVRMDIGMAIGTFDILLNMYAGVVFCIFFFMTALATHFLYFDLTLHMSGKVRELDMAAVAAILAVNGGDKSSGGDFIAMAAEAGERINGHSLVGP
jgi:hypothetical protein